MPSPAQSGPNNIKETDSLIKPAQSGQPLRKGPERQWWGEIPPNAELQAIYLVVYVVKGKMACDMDLQQFMGSG